MTFTPDSEIQDNEVLFRAIHPSFWNNEENKPTSALFKDRKGVSVDRDGNRSQEDSVSFLLTGRENYGVGNLNAGEARNLDTFLKPDSLPENRFHSLILDSETKVELTSRKAKSLSRMINIIIPPSDTEL